MKKLNPCPYCGATSILISRQPVCWNIYCNSCGVTESNDKTKLGAIDKWNKK